MKTESDQSEPNNLTLPLMKAHSEHWYHDPRDPRSPHDAWLARFDLMIPGISPDFASCEATLQLDLLGAYQNGMIRFNYEGLIAYKTVLQIEKIPGKICRRRDWLEDSCEPITDYLRHTIRWENEEWIIEARNITYHWTRTT